MKEVFIKKYWDEEGIMFYLHFKNDKVVAQIEISPHKRVYLSEDLPIVEDSILYDQSISELDLEDNNYITKDEFMSLWHQK